MTPDIPWITVLSVEEVPLNHYRAVMVGHDSVLIVHNQGHYFAIENRCSHKDVALEGGELEGTEIFCPYHGAGFCLKTGQAICPPAYEAIKVFPIRIQDGLVQIQLM